MESFLVLSGPVKLVLKLAGVLNLKTKKKQKIILTRFTLIPKLKKIDIDNKICQIVDTIKENEKDFESFINADLDSCYEKVKYFIDSEEDLDNLDDSNFKFLINQIESFYSENGKFGSLVNFNHKIEYCKDIITGRETAFISETKSEK